MPKLVEEMGRQEKPPEISRQRSGKARKKWWLLFHAATREQTFNLKSMKDRMGKLEKKEMEINKEGKNSTEKY